MSTTGCHNNRGAIERAVGGEMNFNRRVMDVDHVGDRPLAAGGGVIFFWFGQTLGFEQRRSGRKQRQNQAARRDHLRLKGVLRHARHGGQSKQGGEKWFHNFGSCQFSEQATTI